MSLKNWAYICLNNYCLASIQGNTYISYERFIRIHLGELGDMPIGRITNLMVQNHITKLSRLVDENGLRRGEIPGLKWYDVDFERRSISVNKQLVREYKINIGSNAKMHYDTKQPKTKNAKRTIHKIEPLAKEFEEYKEKLLKWKAENGLVYSEGDFVFPSKANTAHDSKTLGHSNVKITGDVYLHMTQPHQKECLDRLKAVYFNFWVLT